MRLAIITSPCLGIVSSTAMNTQKAKDIVLDRLIDDIGLPHEQATRLPRRLTKTKQQLWQATFSYTSLRCLIAKKPVLSIDIYNARHSYLVSRDK